MKLDKLLFLRYSTKSLLFLINLPNDLMQFLIFSQKEAFILRVNYFIFFNNLLSRTVKSLSYMPVFKLSDIQNVENHRTFCISSNKPVLDNLVYDKIRLQRQSNILREQIT